MPDQEKFKSTEHNRAFEFHPLSYETTYLFEKRLSQSNRFDPILMCDESITYSPTTSFPIKQQIPQSRALFML